MKIMYKCAEHPDIETSKKTNNNSVNRKQTWRVPFWSNSRVPMKKPAILELASYKKSKKIVALRSLTQENSKSFWLQLARCPSTNYSRLLNVFKKNDPPKCLSWCGSNSLLNTQRRNVEHTKVTKLATITWYSSNEYTEYKLRCRMWCFFR